MLLNITFSYSRFALNNDLPGGAGGRGKMNKKSSRQRVRRLQVPVLPVEEAAIKSHATNCRLSVAAYLRSVGLHYQPKTVFDADIGLELVRINGDLGRLGGLLKMWLANDERLKLFGAGQIVPKINNLMDEIQLTQRLLFEKVSKL